MQDTKLRPSAKYISKALPHLKGYRAQFALPGLVPDYVREDGEAVIFPTRVEAELAAYRVVLQMANDRLSLATKFKPAAAMPAAELSALLDELDRSPTSLASLLQSEFVMAWLGGERRVPHMAHIILKLMRDPEIEKRVEAITAEAITKGQQI